MNRYYDGYNARSGDCSSTSNGDSNGLTNKGIFRVIVNY